ncbi:MAG TPA: universal stress protein [Ktedonobacteraceae bacterium]|nr:universal stress protein [Ktedonobacteraceae bacterium]
MFKRILVPLDGSALAESVLSVTAQVTSALQGILILFRAYDVPPSDVPLPVIEAQAEQAQTYLAGVARRPELAGLQVETQILGGAAALNVLDAVQEYRADLLVMSSHGRSGFTRWALGSVAEYVIRHASIPVLVLHRPREGEPLRKTAQVALVALDGSRLAETALAPAMEVLFALSSPQEGTLHLARVVAPPVEIHAPESSEQRTPLLEREDAILREAEDYLLGLTERLQAEGLEGHHPTVTWSLHISEDIRATLVRAGEQADQEGHEALFLALATHGRSALERLAAGGSIAVGVLEHTSLPLLIVHAREDRDSV